MKDVLPVCLCLVRHCFNSCREGGKYEETGAVSRNVSLPSPLTSSPGQTLTQTKLGVLSEKVSYVFEGVCMHQWISFVKHRQAQYSEAS